LEKTSECCSTGNTGEGGRDGHGFIGLDSVANRVDYAREPLEGEWAYILNAATTNDDHIPPMTPPN
jgi:hypothetical protein